MVDNANDDYLHSATSAIDRAAEVLRDFDKDIHGHPETAYQEFYAVDRIAQLLEGLGYNITKKTYGLDTSFVTEVGEGGSLVIFCVEYDALPKIGHACGHNLIATSSIAAFLGAAEALKAHKIPGRLRLLGTPAEEGGGGKVKLIEAGAFKEEIAGAIMAHPLAKHQFKPGYSGLAGLKFIASYKFRVEFRGRTAHAAGEPWNGVNALDAAVATYNNISMLRQRMRPDERVHGVIEDGGTVPNVVTEYTRMNIYVRSPDVTRCEALLEKVKKCCEAGAVSTGCEINYIWAPTYKDLRVNLPICKQYVEDMSKLGEKVMLMDDESYSASTDMGNVSYEVPSFHGAFPIETDSDVSLHNPRFAAHAATDQAHSAAIKCAKGMAMLAIRLIADKTLAGEAMKAFKAMG